MPAHDPEVKARRIEAQKERGYRQERRIMEAMSAGPMPTRTVAARTHMSLSNAVIYMRRLRDPENKRIYIHSYEPRSEGAKPSPVYALGNLPDAPLLRQPRKTKAVVDRVGQRKQALLDAMATPRTAKELAVVTRLSVTRVHALLRQLRQPVKQCYIRSWRQPEWRGDLAPLYAKGNRPDAKKPRQSRAERHKAEVSTPEKRKRKNALRRAAAAVKRARANPVTIFTALGL